MILPKPFRNQKLSVYKKFNVIDLVVLIILLGLIILSIGFIPISIIWKIIIIFILSLPVFSLLIFSTKHDCRFYILVFRWFKFKSSIKKFMNSEQLEKGFSDSKNLVPFAKYNEVYGVGFLKTKSLKDGKISIISGLKINGFDLSNLTDEERMTRYLMFQDVSKNIKCKFSIVKVSKDYDFAENFNFYDSKITEIKDKNKELFNSYKTSFEEVDLSSFQINYFIIFYGKDKNELLQNLETTSSNLESTGFGSRKISITELISLQRDIFLPMSNNKFEIIEEQEIDLSSFLAFEKLEIKSKEIIIEENKTQYRCNIQSISEFPLEIRYEWLNILFNTPSSVVVHFDLVDPNLAKSQIHKTNLNLQTNQLSSNNKIVQSIEIDLSQAALEELALKVAVGEELLKTMMIFFVSSSEEEEDIKKMQKINESNCNSINAVINPLLFQQYEGFFNSHLKPTSNLNLNQEIPDETIGGAWPFTNTDLNDESMLLLGSTTDNNVVILDQFKKTDERKNHNMFILGTSGSGKSTIGKKILAYHISQNRKVIIIDPEAEYSDMIDNFEGSLIEIGEGKNTIFNPLQVRMEFQEDESVVSNEKTIAIHIEWVTSWFSTLFPELDDKDLRFFGISLNEIYKDKKFKNGDIQNLKPKDYPVISDLIKSIEKNNTLDPRKEKILEILLFHFEKNGKYQFIYNGYSTIKLESDLIVFDVQSLYNSDSNNSIRAGLFTILSTIQSEIVSNYRKNKSGIEKEIVIFVDEAHLLIDSENPITLNFLHKTTKRIRKYRGAIILTTQNPGDFVPNESTSKKAEALIENMQYAIFMALKSNDIEAVSKMFKSLGGLTKYEKRFLTTAKKGEAIFSPTPSKRLNMKFHYNKLEQSLFFKDKNDNNSKDDFFSSDEDSEFVDKFVPPVIALFRRIKEKREQKKNSKSEMESEI